MTVKLLAIAILALALTSGSVQAQDRQTAPQRGGCASGFCSVANAPQDQATDIDAVEADMKRQLAGQPAAQSRAQGGPGVAGGMMGGMMNMCPCMRMMAMMGQGGMMGRGGMQSMPGMNQPMPGMEQAPPQPKPPAN